MNERRFLWLLPVIAALSIFATQVAAASLAPEKLLDICASSTIADAQAAVDALGWAQQTEEDFRSGRESFVGYNRGSVDIIGRRAAGDEESDSLFFWIARGPNAHRACAYSIVRAQGALEAFIRVLGEPDSLDRTDVVTTAVWEHDGAEIYYSAVGETVLINISYTQ